MTSTQFANYSIHTSNLDQQVSEKITLPYIIKDTVLMGPGVWNENYYDSNSIKEAFNHTDWNSKSVRAVFFDHEDTKATEWIGYVQNPRLEGDFVRGDLELWDESAVRKVVQAKMRCGISPKVKGQEDINTARMSEYVFENFSIVTNPACKLAFLNLSQKIEETESNHIVISPVLQDEDKKNMEAKMEEGLSPITEEVKELKTEEKKVEIMSDKDFVEYVNSLSEQSLSEWSDYVAEKKKLGWDMKKIASEFKKEQAQLAELAEMPEDQIMEKINSLCAILKLKQKKLPKSVGAVCNEVLKSEDDSKIKAMEEKISELSQKLNEPDKKIIRELSTSKELSGSGCQQMMSFLGANLGGVSI